MTGTWRGGGHAGADGRAPGQGDGAGGNGGRGHGSGRGVGRAGSGPRGTRGRHGQGNGGYYHHGEGYNNYDYNYQGGGSEVQGPEFNPNLGQYPPQYEPGWSEQQNQKHGGGYSGSGYHGNRGSRERNQSYRPVHRSVPNNKMQQRHAAGGTTNGRPQTTQKQDTVIGTPEATKVSMEQRWLQMGRWGQENLPVDVTENKGKMAENQSVLHGSSSKAGENEKQMENNMVGVTKSANSGADQVLPTAKTCRRCGLKGHLLYECTTEVYCDICRNNEHALCRCPVTIQPKPVVQLVGQAVDALAAFHILHAPIQPTKRDTRYTKVTVMGEVMTEGELVEALKLSIKDNYE